MNQRWRLKFLERTAKFLVVKVLDYTIFESYDDSHRRSDYLGNPSNIVARPAFESEWISSDRVDKRTKTEDIFVSDRQPNYRLGFKP